MESVGEGSVEVPQRTQRKEVVGKKKKTRIAKDKNMLKQQRIFRRDDGGYKIRKS